MKLEEAHQFAEELRKELKKNIPDHPSLKIIYHSTWAEIDAYYEALHGRKFFESKEGVKC